jgi:hypothetical protein
MKKVLFCCLLICCTKLCSAQCDEINGVKATVNEVFGKVNSRSCPSGIDSVLVSVEGTTISTRTDKNGYYSIALPIGNNTLAFSFVNMRTVKKHIRCYDQVDVKMTLKGSRTGVAAFCGTKDFYRKHWWQFWK